MLELCDTMNLQGAGPVGMDGAAMYDAVHDLIEEARLRPSEAEETWTEERCLFSECALMDGDELVGFGRLVWDPDIDGALPRIFDLAVRRAYRSRFIIDAIQAELIEQYAYLAEAGEEILTYEGKRIDISPVAARLRDPSAPRLCV
ncbi:GNAT family N-acetyltransferase [Litorivita sp. NS0012-18]|uniref:GNAT family N-acetyltransferase n=1 Tax=Litorivita sp. NS0012-18 TaxID=3127655 RepID=UPI0031048977